ncbi:Protein phosphatase 2C 6 [Tilletia horrida]|uniref:Protein phosphatase 2C 6 n=1 Tax=Tilletia horrida TaxID=155126 RepID=A0AAN6JT32_9BASI|nr:Protein phosphatase 2C 6 [Tilletia horrida]
MLRPIQAMLQIPAAPCSSRPHRGRPSRPAESARIGQHRTYQDYFRVRTEKGSSARVTLAPNSVYGVATSRGTRPYQEDTYAVACLSLPPSELAATYERPPAATDRDKKVATEWKAKLDETSPDVKTLASQLMWFGCYDGHGGQAVSAFLRNNLHRIFESVDPSYVTDTVQYTRALGGYFRRFTGGEISRWVRQEHLKPVRAGPALAPGKDRSPNQRPPSIVSTAELQRQEEEEARKKPKTLADLIDSGGSGASDASSKSAPGEEEGLDTEAPADIAPKGQKPPHSRRRGEPVPDEEVEDFPTFTERLPPPEGLVNETMTLAERATLTWLIADRVIQLNDDLNVGGSTASVVLLHSLDVPTVPFYSSKQVGMTAVHVGDTRLLLCAKSTGEAIPLTNYHHPEDPAESERLRRVGAGMVTDSFGEARWMGALANTRAFGDSRYKRAGVTAEPEVITRIINGDDFAFIIAFSDGIGGVMSDQEIVDLCRDAKHPSQAAKSVLTFAEELGSEDNGTVLCIPMRGWGQVGGKDTTKERRELRRSKTDIFRDHRQ